MADLEGNQLPGANRGSFLTFPMGFVLGLFTAVFGSFLMEEAHGQEPQSVLVEDAARVSGDWGIQRVQAVPGQRIPVRLSLQEINRISFEDDEAFNVRVAENNVRGAPIIQFERDNRTGDMYATIANGAAGQVLSAFVTTDLGHTYHLLFTIENQPATHVTIAGPTANDQFELSSSDSSAPINNASWSSRLLRSKSRESLARSGYAPSRFLKTWSFCQWGMSKAALSSARSSRCRTGPTRRSRSTIRLSWLMGFWRLSLLRTPYRQRLPCVSS